MKCPLRAQRNRTTRWEVASGDFDEETAFAPCYEKECAWYYRLSNEAAARCHPPQGMMVRDA